MYFLLDYVDLIKFNSNRAEVEEDFYSSVSEMYTSVANTMNGGYSAAGIYSGFFASISSAFSSTELLEFRSNYNQYYGSKHYSYGDYTLTLPNSESFVSSYIDYFDQDYYMALDELYNSYNRDFDSFFDTYGTHMIASAIYGCKLEGYYVVTSNNKYFSTEVINDIETEINVLYSNFAAGGSLSISNVEFDSMSNEECYKKSHIITYGGNPTYAAYLSNGVGGYVYNWQSSLDENNAVLIGYEDLIGLWDILPTEFSSMSYEMENAFEDYYDEKYDDFLGEFDYSSVILFDGSQSQLDIVRSINDVYTIDDSGRFDNDYDTVYFADDLDVELSRYKAQGFTTIDIEIQLEVSEIDDGYQHIFIYQNSNTSESSNLLIGEAEFEHTEGALNSLYFNETIYINNLDINLFNNSGFVIRYGASGTGDDTWQNRLLKVKVTLNK